MSAKLPYPEFANESEEAEWLYEHRDDLDCYFEPVSGSVREVLLRDHDLVLPDQRVLVKVSDENLGIVGQRAAAEGLDAGAYLERIVHDALRSEHHA
jgi:hypothetical protein